MTLYVDSSALLKRYFEEDDSDVALELMASDPMLVSSPLAGVEVNRNLALRLDAVEYEEARARFRLEFEGIALIALDASTCAEASRVAEQTGCRSLDALHLGSALRAGSATTVLTFDRAQARAARAVGLTVVGC